MSVGEASGADEGDQRTGVCVLRVETELDRLLITVTTERYLHRGLALAGGRSVRHFTDPADAVGAVESFVRSYHPHGSRSGTREG